MILDTIANFSRYAREERRLARGLEYIAGITDKNELSPGKHEIEGDEIYAIAVEYRTKAAEIASFEAHAKYIDIQYVVSGEEVIEWAPVGDLDVVKEYSEEDDASFLAGDCPTTRLYLRQAEFFEIEEPEEREAVKVEF